MKQTSRRSFLKTTVGGSLGLALTPSFVPARLLGADAPSKKIQVAQIGCGRMGRSALGNVLTASLGRVVAVCDLDSRRLAEGRKMALDYYAQRGESSVDIKTYHDYREVLASPRAGFGGDVVGVVAPDPETAEKALAALRAEWTPAPGQPSSDDVYTYFKQTAEGGPAADTGLTTYTIAYIAHVPLEPRAALAEWNEGKLTVWTGTQSPFGVRRELMAQFQLLEESVHVLMPDAGSGYGGKHQGDAAIEAAILAKAAGRPVQRNWTREEELTWSYFRPGAVIEVTTVRMSMPIVLASILATTRRWCFQLFAAYRVSAKRRRTGRSSSARCVAQASATVTIVGSARSTALVGRPST